MTTTPSTASQAPAVNAREEARKHVHSLTARTTELVGQVIAKGMLGVLEECIEMQLRMNALEARATEAEAKLEAIRQGVEKLPWTHQCKLNGYTQWESVDRAKVIALLQPQPQADESGLPG